MKIGKSVLTASKPSMNLIIKEEKTVNPVRLLLTIVCILAVAAVVVKFGFIDRYEKVAMARRALNDTEDMLMALKIADMEYDSVVMEYNRYSFGAMTEEEQAVADRGEVLDLIEKYLIPAAQIESASLGGNALSVQLSGVTLQEAAGLLRTLEEDERVAGVTVYTAEKEKKNDSQGDSPDSEIGHEATVTITITLEKTRLNEKLGLEETVQEGGE